MDTVTQAERQTQDNSGLVENASETLRQIANNQQETHSKPYVRGDVQISLLTALLMLQSEKVGEGTIDDLAGKTPLARDLKALSTLWQSLGCPDNIFWSSTVVFYNRIVDAPDSQKA
jgi:hypothetical protein